MDKLKNLEFKANGLAYKKWMKWVEIPYTDLVQAYRQVEEAKANICCGRAVFEIHRVILVGQDGEKIAVEVPDRENGVEILKRLEKENPRIKIGTGKKAKDQTAGGEKSES